MAFESIQSSLSPYEDFKNFKSQDEFEMFQKLQSLKNNYWSPIPHKLLYNHSIDQQAKILWAILQHLGDAEGKSYYSQKKLAYFYGCSTKTISRYQQIC